MKGWNQHDLAAACSEIAREKRSASWVRGYEQQTRWPKPEDLDLLGAALDVDPASLIAPPREPSPKEALAVLGAYIEKMASTIDLSGAPADLIPSLASAGPAEWAVIRVALEGQAMGKERSKRVRNKRLQGKDTATD